ncbi:WXG100 family type VII secretion target [Streptomyces mirabilis]
MPGTYSYDSDSLMTGGQQINQISTQLLDTIEQLKSQTLAALEEWLSDNRNLYSEIKQTWDNAAAQVSQDAAQASSALERIRQELDNGEAQGRQRWASL